MNTVLVADSEPLQRLLVRDILSEVPALRVIETGDGKLAYNLVREHHPCAVILDVLLPHLDGLSLCSLIKVDPVLSKTRVIVLTAQSDESRGRQAGCDAYLTKPFEASLFVDTVRRVLGR